MSSEIKVDTISEKTSANGVTIDGVNLKDSVVKTDTISEKTSAAGVTIDGVLIKDGVVANATVTEYDSWQLNSNLTASAAPITNFDRPDGTLQVKIGTGMSISSGIFTFPSTGIWEVRAELLYSQSADQQYVNVKLYATDDDGSAWDEIAYNGYRASNNSVGSGTIRALLDIEDVSTDKVKWEFEDADGSGSLLGESTRNRSHFTFIRIGDT